MKKSIIRNLIVFFISLIIFFIPSLTYSYENILFGDINGDGKVDSIDLLYIMRHIVAENGYEHKEWILEGEKFNVADVTQNGAVNSSDLLVILRYIAAKNNPEEIGIKHKDWLELKVINVKKEDSRKNQEDNSSYSQNAIKENNNIEIDNKVEEPDVKEDEIKSIKLNKSLIEIEKEETEQVIAIVEPKESNNEIIEWKVLNTQIAEVDETGKITGKKNGETIVIARTTNGKEAVSKVRVGTYPKAIVINKEEVKIDLSKKRTEKVEVRVEPEDASNKEVEIENSNERVATIDKEGKITAKENGDTELTFKTANGIEKKIKVKVETSAIGVKLDKNYVQLDLSQNKESIVKATVEPSTASNKEVTYTSSNERVATVDKNGKITAKGNGETNIIVKTTNGKEAVCKVEVQTVATKINMDKSVSIDLSKEKEKTIKVEVEPKDAKNKSVMIRSSNEEVATIDANGTIKAKKNGEATITAEIAGTDIVETCKVTVITSPTGLKLSKTNVSLDVSETKSTKLTAEVEPSTASNKNIKWTNGNSEIVYLSSTGEEATLTGLENGEATIIATIEGTNISKECKVTVTTSPKSIKLNKTSATLDMSGTKTIQLSATIEPSTASNKEITYISSNTSIATVDKNGKVAGKKNGTATITAKTSNNKESKCTITVLTNPTGIQLNKSSLSIRNGKTAILTAKVLPSTVSNKTVTWSSSNKAIAAVDKNGKVTGKKVGSATILAKTSNGKKASCKITVIRKYNNDSLEPDTKNSILGWQEYNKYYGSYYITQTGAYDGTHIIAAQNDGVIKTPREVGRNGGRLAWYNIKTGKLTNTLKIGPEGYHMARMAYDSDRNMVLVGVVGENKLIQVNNSTKKFASQKYTYLSDGTYNLAYDSYNHQLLGFAGNNINFYKYNKNTNKYVKTKSIKLKPSGVSGYPENFCTDGDVIYAVYRMGGSVPNGKVLAFDINSGKLVESHKENGSKFYVYKNTTSGHVQDAIIDSEGKMWMICGQVYWKVKNY
ncbi:MAG: Ig-like domain-containing protein [Clostridia bacterium]|nr:Ig-like domain-containing protein [Clostridia bacterium]